MNSLPDAAGQSAPSFLTSASEMASLMRAYDWSTSPLGPADAWPQPLKTLVSLILGSSQPMFIAWGREHILLYNDGYAEILAGKHPAVGQPFLQVWSEIRADLGPIVEQAYAGQPVQMDDIRLIMRRKGFPEEAHFAFSYTPVRCGDGLVGGFLGVCLETTAQVLAERRRTFLIDLERQLRDVSDPVGIVARAQEALGTHLEASRVGYGEVDTSGRYFTTPGNWTDGTVTPRHGTHDLAGFGRDVWAALRRGEKLVVRDVHTDPRTSAPEQTAAFGAIDAAAVITVSLVKDGRMRAALYVHQRTARHWTDDDVALVEEVAERTWAAVERARAEQQLRVERDRSQRVLENITDGFILLDRDFRVLDINAEGMKLEKRPREAIIGKSHWEAWPGTEHSELGRLYKRAMRDRTSVTLEHRYVWPDGRATWLEMRAYPVSDGLALFYRDVSDRRQADAAQREVHERLGNLVNQAAAGICQADTEGRIVLVNARFCDLVGRSSNELVGQRLLELTHPEDAPAKEKALAQLMDTGEPFFIEKRYIRPDGSVVWVTNHVSLVQDAQGQPQYVSVVAIDISERKRIEEALREREERLRVAQAAGAVGTFELLPATGRIVVSEEVCRLWGVPFVDEVDIRHFTDLIHPEDRQRVHTDRSTLPERALDYIEYRIIRPDTGEVRWMARKGEAVCDAASGQTRYFGVSYDITERKAAEQALEEERSTLETLNRTGAALAAERDLDVIVQMVTDAGVELTGAQFGAFFYNVTDERGESLTLYTLSGVDRSAFERFPMPRATAVFKPTFDGTSIVRVGDITADPRYGKNKPHHGMPEGHLPVRSYLAVPVKSRSGEVLGGLFFGHAEPGVFTERAERVIEGIAAQAAIAVDNARLLQAMHREVEERRSAQEALRQLNETLEARVASRTADVEFLYNSAPVPLHSQSPDGVLISVSDRWLEFMGYDSRDEVIGRRAVDFLTAESAKRHLDEYWPRLLANGTADDVEYQVVKKSGAVADVLISSRLDYDDEGRFIRTMGAVVDVTARKRTEEALRQSQKLEAIGQLTGGVAHDFNNLLTIIRSSVDLLQRKELSTDKQRRYIDAISETADRAAKLTSQLLAFARRQALKPEPFDVADRVRSVCEMIKTVAGARIRLEMNVEINDAFIEADVAQFETALVNLAVNARDAMDGAGQIAVGVRQADQIPSSADRAEKAGEFIAVSIADTGHGIPADKLTKIFEPFFTTKEVGKGTGLGLSQVYGFVKQSGGEVAVESELGRGTIFTLYLPRTKSRPVANQAPGNRNAMIGAKRARILVVEDNTDVGQFATQLLREFGHDTVWAPSAEVALEWLETEAASFDLVFSDVVMPGMGGIALGQEIRRRYPDLPVVLTSGYSHVLAEEGRYGFELLQKPYSVEALSQVLQRFVRHQVAAEPREEAGVESIGQAVSAPPS